MVVERKVSSLGRGEREVGAWKEGNVLIKDRDGEYEGWESAGYI